MIRTYDTGFRRVVLKDGVRVTVGVHWGATLMVGQVSTRGRLEVTALGDEMNEAARIETAAHGGVVLASKDTIERLDEADAESLALNPDALAYRTVAELTDAEKAVRDAGSIAVAEGIARHFSHHRSKAGMFGRRASHWSTMPCASARSLRVPRSMSSSIRPSAGHPTNPTSAIVVRQLREH
jgi:hypothetical protein